MQASVEDSIQCLSSLLTNFEHLVCCYTMETYHIQGIQGLREFRSMNNARAKAMEHNINSIVDMQDELERVRIHLVVWQRCIRNMSSNLAILPTKIIQEILVAGMMPDHTNINYLRVITWTSHQLRQAALGCSNLWVNLSKPWSEQQLRVWMDRLQGRPAKLHVFSDTDRDLYLYHQPDSLTL